MRSSGDLSTVLQYYPVIRTSILITSIFYVFRVRRSAVITYLLYKPAARGAVYFYIHVSRNTFPVYMVGPFVPTTNTLTTSSSHSSSSGPLLGEVQKEL